MSEKKHLFLIDGSAYIFRAYHALPPLTRKSDGLPIGAVSGFCNMIWKLLQTPEFKPTHIAVIFDHSSKTFRNDIYPEYKANREEPPEDLRPQFSLVRKATTAFNLPSIEKENFEADDLIATYIKQAKQQKMATTIFSSDKDLMQLVDKNILMFDSMKDVLIDENAVIEKFGVAPNKMIDLQSLAGDSSDNVPGVPGIGPKIAAELLGEFNTLENLLENANKIKQQKRRENLIEFKQQALISKKLVTLDENVKLDIPLGELTKQEIDSKKLVGFLKGIGLNSLTKRIASELDCDAQEIEAENINAENNTSDDYKKTETKKTSTQTKNKHENLVESFVNKKITQGSNSKINKKSYQTIFSLDELKKWLTQIEQNKLCAFDCETTSLDAMAGELVGISLATFFENNIKACYIPINHIEGGDDLLGSKRIAKQLAEKQVLELLKPMLESKAILKIAQNMKYDYLLMARKNIFINSFDDTMLISYVLDAGNNRHNMNELSEKWLGHTPISFKEVTNENKIKIFNQVPIQAASIYACEDADITLRLWQVLFPQLIRKKLIHVYQRLEIPLVKILCNMEMAGILIDEKILKNLSLELAKDLAKLAKEIYKLADQEFNIASPKQLGEILFGKMNLPGAKKTKSGQYSTSVQVLETLANDGHKLPMKIVDWRQLAKLKSTYTDALPEFINKQTGRVHTSYAMASTSTGRLSSSEPNLQNIPVRTKIGRQIRQAFITEKNYQLVSADYSQIELRLLAHIADIKPLKQAFANGQDIHAATASEMFGVPLDNLDPTTRRQAKAINFGIIYGISAYGLANQLNISRTEAGEYIDLYFKKFSGIKSFMENIKQQARKNGYVETIFGRRAYYPDINSKNQQVRAFNERAAINAPIQGSAADLLRRAMIFIEPAISKAKLDAKMLLQVHDELIFEVKKQDIEKLTIIVREIMQNAAMPAINISVPLQVDIQAANNWDDAH